MMTNMSETNLNHFSRNVSDEGLQLHLTEQVVLIIQIILTITTCPFTIVLNILVILAVKKTPRLQSKPNILLACLAVTDAFIGLTAQPSCILVELFRLIDMNSLAEKLRFYFHDRALSAGITNSLLHLMLVTFERLVAIKFTIRYPYVITEKNIKMTVAAFWAIALCTWGMGYITHYVVLLFNISSVQGNIILCDKLKTNLFGKLRNNNRCKIVSLRRAFATKY